MSTLINLTYYGVDGTGKTVKEAKADAGRKIEAAMSGSYSPDVVTWRGNSILIWRSPEGWHCTYIAEHGQPRERLGGWSSPEGKTAQEARTVARYRVAQSGWTPEDGDALPEIIASEDRHTAAEWRHWVEFQLRYRRALAAGCDSNEAHHYAGKFPPGNTEWPALVAKVEGNAGAAA